MNSYHHYRINGCTVIPETNTLAGPECTVTLEPKTMDCLVFFLSQPGEIITKAQLVRGVWHGVSISDEAITRVIHLIRKAFIEAGVADEVIHTHRKRGYQLIQAVTKVVRPTVRFRPLLAGCVFFAMVMVSGVVAVKLGYVGSLGDFNGSKASPQLKQFVEVRVDKKLSEKNAVAFTLLINKLVESISRQETLIAIFNEEGESSDTQRRYDFLLKFDAILPGDTSLPQYAVTAYRADEEIWRAVYPLAKDLNEAASHHRTIISEFLQRIDSKLSQVAGCEWPNNIDALEQFFLGKKLLSQRGVKNIEAAILHFKAAISKAPEFAKAWADISYAYTLLPVYKQLSTPPAVDNQQRFSAYAEKAADKALTICPSEVTAIYVNGVVPAEIRNNVFLAREYRIRKALSIEPDNAELLRIYAEHLWQLGRFSSAMEFLLRARIIEPWNARIQRDYADGLIQLGEYRQAAEVLTRAESLGFNARAYNLLMWLRIYLHIGEFSKAQAYAEQYHSNHLQLIQAIISLFEKKSPHFPEDEWHVVSEQLRAQFTANHDYVYFLHKLAMLIGDYELAIKTWLAVNKVQAHGFTIWWSERNEIVAFTEFQEWAKHTGMFEYWKNIAPPDRCEVSNDILKCSPDE